MGNACGSASDAGSFEAGIKKAKKMNPEESKHLSKRMAKAYILKYDSNKDG